MSLLNTKGQLWAISWSEICWCSLTLRSSRSLELSRFDFDMTHTLSKEWLVSSRSSFIRERPPDCQMLLKSYSCTKLRVLTAANCPHVVGNHTIWRVQISSPSKVTKQQILATLSNFKLLCSIIPLLISNSFRHDLWNILEHYEPCEST